MRTCGISDARRGGKRIGKNYRIPAPILTAIAANQIPADTGDRGAPLGMRSENSIASEV